MGVSVLEFSLLSATISVGFYLLARSFNERYGLEVTLRRLVRTQEALDHEIKKRQSERQGRINAERELAQLKLQAAQLADQMGEPVHSQSTLYPMRAIGHVHSCFQTRNGTPRQPTLVPAARSRFVLSPGVPAVCLDGLQAYSHCWLLFIFHENTDQHKALQRGGAIKSIVRVPRLNGGRVGVLATRSPHRPTPLGLSVAQVLQVDTERGEVLLGGTDLVDGSPVLDIKPYIPFCDSLPHSTAPAWVAADPEDDPLRIADVDVSDDVCAELAHCWERAPGRRLCSSAQEHLQLVQQVLSRDIRSAHQRSMPSSEGPSGVLASRGAHALAHKQPSLTLPNSVVSPDPGGSGITAELPLYQVALDGVNVRYNVISGGGTRRVRVVGVQVWQRPAGVKHSSAGQAEGSEGQGQQDP